MPLRDSHTQRGAEQTLRWLDEEEDDSELELQLADAAISHLIPELIERIVPIVDEPPWCLGRYDRALRHRLIAAATILGVHPRLRRLV